MNNHGNIRVIVNWVILCIMLAGLYAIGTVYSTINKKAAEVHVFSPDVVAQEIRLDNVQELTFTQGSMKIVGRLNPEKAKDRGPAFKSEAVSLEHVDEIRKLAEEKKVKYNVLQPPPEWIGSLLQNMLWILIFFLVFRFFIGRQTDGANKFLSRGGKKFQVNNDKRKKKVLFTDVAGCDEAKEEVVDVVEFLRNPQAFSSNGGKIPRGILLMGDPGVGKTELARAVAGEANVPFLEANGPEFMEMFVGVGAARIRTLFEEARACAPCVVFIDEIDAIGKKRSTAISGGHEEREQTLNQLLVELDGFEENPAPIIILAATNRPDVLDGALVRPGRFDRKVHVPKPDIDGRHAILKIHAVGKKFSPNIDLHELARSTTGMVGADLANVLNEAALLSSKKKRPYIEQVHLNEAVDRVTMGPARKSMKMSDFEKQMTAYHEGGHTLVAKLIKNTDPMHKVTIIPRGPSLGSTWQIPAEDRHSYTKDYILARLKVLAGGRVAEELIFGEDKVTTGASDDFNKATRLARKMVFEWGMSPVGLAVFKGGQGLYGESNGVDASPSTKERLEAEVEKILQKTVKEVRELLTFHRAKLDALAKALLEKETLNALEVDQAINSA